MRLAKPTERHLDNCIHEGGRARLGERLLYVSHSYTDKDPARLQTCTYRGIADRSPPHIHRQHSRIFTCRNRRSPDEHPSPDETSSTDGKKEKRGGSAISLCLRFSHRNHEVSVSALPRTRLSRQRRQEGEAEERQEEGREARDIP